MQQTLLDISRFKSLFEIPLTAEPNQSFNFDVLDKICEVKLRLCGKLTICDFEINNEVVFQGLPATPNIDLLQNFKYKTDLILFFATTGQRNLSYLDFGTSVRLFYAEI